MIRVAVIDSPAAARVVARAAGMELVEDDARPDVFVVDPDGEGLARCSLLSARGERVVVFASAADEVVLLGADVAGAAAVASSRGALLRAIRGAAELRLAA